MTAPSTPSLSQSPRQAVTGVLLAGGRAERMGGRDKGLLPLNGRPMASYALTSLAAQVHTVLINANRHPNEYAALGYPVVADDAEGEFFGPLAGMLAAMGQADTPYILTVPCDSPLLPADYAQRMVTALLQEGAELAVAKGGDRLQPVFALLPTALQGSLRAYLQRGERKIDRWFATFSMATVVFEDSSIFRNVNTPEELADLAQTLRDGTAAG